MVLESIRPGPDGHSLVTNSGEPFFWLADTAWELFHRLNRAEAELYLETRRNQGFNVIQAVVLAELDGLHTPNANGHLPLLGDDPTRLNEFYFNFVDEVIRLAAEKGLYIGLLPTWGDKVNKELWGIGPVIFDVDRAKKYGRLLGSRYRNDSNILWILGGDRPGKGYEPLWNAMAEGIIEGSGYKPFFAYHPWGGVSSLTQPWTGCSSSEWFHETEWLDMNMWQSGHLLQDAPNWKMIASDYLRNPSKPVLDAEPNYENHPVDPFLRKWKCEYGRFSDHDVRKQAYRAVFAGACGHTYGHHSVWQFWSPKCEPVNFPMPDWEEAIFAPGAAQMCYLKQLMLARPFFHRVPAQDLLMNLPALPIIDNEKHFDPVRAGYPCATKALDYSFAMVYFPMAGQDLIVDLSLFPHSLKAAWFDPRNGKTHDIGEFQNQTYTFTSPFSGPDWVLLLDVSKGK